MKSFVYTCLLLLSTHAAIAAAPFSDAAITASLTTPSPEVLPGVPVDLVVTYTNVSKHTASAGVIASLAVQTPDGKVLTFPDLKYRLQPFNEDDDYPVVTLAPGESVQRAVIWDRGSSPGWSQQVPSGPGVYEYTLDLLCCRDDDSPNDYVGPIRTTTARVTRVTPTGEDAEVWKKIAAVAGDRFPERGLASLKESAAIVDDIIRVHPTSAYYPYALLFSSRFPQQENATRCVDAAQRFPNSPAYPYLLLEIAHIARSKAVELSHRHEYAAAARAFTEASRLYGAASKTSNIGVQGVALRAQDVADLASRVATDSASKH